MVEKILRKLFRKTIDNLELRAYREGSNSMAWGIVQDTKRNTVTVWEDETGVYKLGVVDE